jgi:membrane dipeptidase
VFSHSNPGALVPNPRNIDDEQIRACIGRGGIIGLVAWGPLVKKPDASAWPALDEFIDLVDYVVQMSGTARQVGIGTDMSLGTYPEHRQDPWGEPSYPEVSGEYGRLITPDIRSPKRSLNGFSDYAEIVNVAERLLARGYRDDDVHAILGGNYLRIFDQVWRQGSS